MPCSICGRAEGASTPRCPHCPPDLPQDAKGAKNAKGAMLVPTEAATSAQDSAVDPEVLPPEDGRGADRGSFGGQNIFGSHQSGTQSEGSTSSFRFAVWHGASSGGSTGSGGSGGSGGFGGPGAFGGMGVGRSSCLPGCITLFLTLVCAVQFGVLAALGFVVFHLMGSGAVLALNLQQIMQGRRAYWGLDFGPWLGRIVVWAASWALAGWLSDGF